MAGAPCLVEVPDGLAFAVREDGSDEEDQLRRGLGSALARAPLKQVIWLHAPRVAGKQGDRR
jgi:hypothetical protein